MLKNVEVKVVYRQVIAVNIEDDENEEYRIGDDVDALVADTPDYVEDFEYDDFSYKVV